MTISRKLAGIAALAALCLFSCIMGPLLRLLLRVKGWTLRAIDVCEQWVIRP